MTQNNMEVVAYAEVIDGKVVSVRLDKSRHCTEPLVTLTSAQAEMGWLVEDHEANMENMLSIVDVHKARAEAAEKERDALREALEEIVATEARMIGVPIDTEAANEFAMIASSAVDVAHFALQPLEPKND